ncbi:hypothetical protein TNCV_3282381 [Trichonephila clavipes]|nr:hypothetical protein TNCV_3282381 [Trichonephila clavipes]
MVTRPLLACSQFGPVVQRHTEAIYRGFKSSRAGDFLRSKAGISMRTVPAQVSSSSLDHDSKFRDRSLISLLLHYSETLINAQEALN